MFCFRRYISVLLSLVLNSFKPKRATADHTDNDFLVMCGLDMFIKMNEFMKLNCYSYMHLCRYTVDAKSETLQDQDVWQHIRH